MKFWIIVASREHVKNGEKEGIAQACHGKGAPLKRMKKGDWIIYYSSKLKFGKPEPCQKFTAIGQCKDDNVYQVDLGDDFKPLLRQGFGGQAFRKDIMYYPSNEVSIIPMIPDLTFIKNKKSWGGVFRYGVVQIPKEDFVLIVREMIKDIKHS